MPQNWWEDDASATPAPPAAAGGASTRPWWEDDSAGAGAGAAADVKPEGTHWGEYIPGIVRGVTGFIGRTPLVGSLVSGGGELLAQTMEKTAGEREAYNFPQVGVQAALGAIPAGKGLAKSLGSRAVQYLHGLVQGAVGGAGTDIAQQLGEGGDHPYDIGQTIDRTIQGGELGLGGGAIAHGFEHLLGRGAPAAGALTRDVLRHEADAATTLPKPVMGRDEVQTVRGDGGPGVHRTPGTPRGPITGRDQLTGIDPAQLTPPAEPAQAWWAPQVRGESNVTDVGGPIAGALDAPRGPGNQGGREMPPEMGSRRIPLDAPDRPFDTGPVGSDPFEIAPATLSDKFLRKGKSNTAAVPAPVTPPAAAVDEEALNAAYKRSQESFLARMATALDAGVDRRANEIHEAAYAARPSAQIAAAAAGAAKRPTVQGPHGPVDAGKPYVPSEIASVYQTLKPKWADTAAETGVNMHEDPLDFNRRVLGSDNPRKLMGAERKALAAVKAKGKPIWLGQPRPAIPSSPPAVQEGGFTDHLDHPDRLTEFLDDESGQMDPELARRLGLHVGGAALGAGVGAATSDDQHRLRDTVGGAAAGAALPLAFSKSGRDLLSKGRYFGMLSSAGAQAKNLAGNAGSTVVRAGEEALTGNTAGAKQILASVFSRDTAGRMIDAFKHSNRPGDSRWGATSGALGIPSRVMHAVDEGATQGLEQGGLSHDEAKLSLFTSDPRSKVGQQITGLAQRAPYLVPFARTGMNMVERGMEHMPGVGMLPDVRAMRGDSHSRVMARQAMGALALLAGGTIGSDNPYVSAALGPLALPFAAGTAARTAYDKRKGDPLTNVAKSQTDLMRKELPLPTDAYDFDPSRYLASYVPSVLRDASRVDPKTLAQDGLFDPAIAKVPFLNSALLKRKPTKKRPTQAGR